MWGSPSGQLIECEVFFCSAFSLPLAHVSSSLHSFADSSHPYTNSHFSLFAFSLFFALFSFSHVLLHHPHLILASKHKTFCTQLKLRIEPLPNQLHSNPLHSSKFTEWSHYICQRSLKKDSEKLWVPPKTLFITVGFRSFSTSDGPPPPPSQTSYSCFPHSHPLEQFSVFRGHFWASELGVLGPALISALLALKKWLTRHVAFSFDMVSRLSGCSDVWAAAIRHVLPLRRYAFPHINIYVCT